MTISAKIIADSISPDEKRITTFELRYPRFIHSEFMTHRQFSRNASSSRAIPVERMIQDVIDDPAMPIHWGKNEPGMQAREEHDALITLNVPTEAWHEEPTKKQIEEASVVTLGGLPLRDRTVDLPIMMRFERHELPPETVWLQARNAAIERASAFAKAGYHKQIVNRLLETWLHINVVVTATEWSNFFALRMHPDAQPEIRSLAGNMWVAMKDSTPEFKGFNDWHLPYVDQNPGPDSDMVWAYAKEHDLDLIEAAKMLSVARCASVSYKTVDGKPMTLERAAAIYDKLVKADVFHASPFEHQATPDEQARVDDDGLHWPNTDLHGNFFGWIQNRKIMENNLPL